MLQRLLREIKIPDYLDHPKIVEYYTAWLEVDTIESFIEGPNLGKQGNTPKSPTCGFSSNLLAGPASNASVNPSPLLNMRNNKKRKRCQPSTNPLGWNNFSVDGSFSFDDESHSLSKYFSKKGGIEQR